MSRICESCGAPEAVLYAYYPAVLCDECVAIRVAERKAAEAYKAESQRRKAAESAPDPAMMFTEPARREPTALLHVDRSEAELTQLRSLDDIKRAREDRYRARKSLAESATKPKTPLAVKVNAVVNPKVKASVPMDTLMHCDAIYSTTERLAISCPLDATHLAKALLKTLLRLAWVRASGKSNTNPDPSEVPNKLFNRQVITLAAMRRIDKAVKRDTSTTSNLLECCRCLMVWLASEPGAVMSALEDEQSELQKAVAGGAQ